MNKLQLYITMSEESYKELVAINNDDGYIKSWVCDLSSAVKEVAYDANKKNIFYMVKYIDSGCFIIVIRTITGHHGYHLASWIFLPYTLNIDNDDVNDVVDFVTEKVSNDQIDENDIREITKVFGRTFEENLLAPSFPPSEGLEHAHRFYGSGLPSLAELLGAYRYQPCYLSFAGVFLIDKSITGDVSGPDLTGAPLDKMASLLPPAIASVDGYHPTIYDDEFDVPYFAPMQRKIDIVWRKPGAPDKQMTITVSKPEMRAPSLPRQEQPLPQPPKPWEDDYDPFPSNPAVADDKPWGKRPEDERTKEERAKTEKAAAGPAPLVRRKVYNFEVPAKFGTIIDFTITTDQELYDSPLEGYEIDNIKEGTAHINRLNYSGKTGGTPWLQKALFAVGGMVVGALVALLATCSGHDTAAKPGNDTVVEAVGATQPADTAVVVPAPVIDGVTYDLEAAVKYLDANRKWEKGEMEKYPDLAGLFDDLNAINRTKIIDVWGPKLEESRTFSVQILKHIKQGERKTPRKQPYTDGNIITVQDYLNNIDP